MCLPEHVSKCPSCSRYGDDHGGDGGGGGDDDDDEDGCDQCGYVYGGEWRV